MSKQSMPGGYAYEHPKKKKKRQKGWTLKMDKRSNAKIEDSLDKFFAKKWK